jgi:hypothetical protein
VLEPAVAGIAAERLTLEGQGHVPDPKALGSFFEGIDR